MQEIAKNTRAFWVDPEDRACRGSGTSCWVTVTDTPKGALEDDDIVRCVSDNGSEIEVHPGELALIHQPNGEPVDSGSMTVFIVAEALTDRVDDEDADVAGIYEVGLQGDPLIEHPGTAAIDVFHEEIGVSNPGDFDFTAWDFQGQPVPDTHPEVGQVGGDLLGASVTEILHAPSGWGV